MSNCAEITRNATVIFRAPWFDVERFRANVEKHDLHSDGYAASDDPLKAQVEKYGGVCCTEQGSEDCKGFIHWFAGKRNARFALNGKSVEVEFGGGRSMHTFRDLNGTVWFLGRYMAPGKSLKHTFWVIDEGDPTAEFKYQVEFKRV